jgi:hypothetical protein
VSHPVWNWTKIESGSFPMILFLWSTTVWSSLIILRMSWSTFCKSVTQYHMFVNTSCLLSVGDKFSYTRQHVAIRPPPTGVTHARVTWDVTPPSPFTPSSGYWPLRREPDIMGFFRSDLENSCGLFYDAGGNPVSVQGNITFSGTQEVSVVSVGFFVSRHVVSRWCFRHRIGRHRRGTSRWVPGNQSSLEVFMTICRSRFTLADSTRSSRHPYSRFFDSSTSSWHLYTRGTFTSHGFHGESLDCRHGTSLLGTHVDCCLRPPFMSEIKSVTLE